MHLSLLMKTDKTDRGFMVKCNYKGCFWYRAVSSVVMLIFFGWQSASAQVSDNVSGQSSSQMQPPVSVVTDSLRPIMSESLLTASYTLEEAIAAAQEQSVDAMMARHTFLAAYWEFKSFKASRLPSLNVVASLAQFDRSLRLLQNSETGDMNYVSNYNLQNSVGLQIVQNISFTGGTLSLNSDLSRLDQFQPSHNKTYYSQPVTLSYTQPLFAYNQFKWDKKIEPQKYEYAKRQYIESMEDVTSAAVELFFGLLLQKTKYDIACKNYENTRALCSVAKERLKLGTVTQDEVLQLELRMLNDSLSINTGKTALRESQLAFNSLLRLRENVDVMPVLNTDIPKLTLNYNDILDKALYNSSFTLGNEIAVLQAESEVAQAKAQRGASATLSARFGLSQSDDVFKQAYKGLLDQEVIGLTVSFPIFDWGMGRGRVKMAEARSELARTEAEQKENDFRRELFTLTEQFNNQRSQFEVALRAREIADRRYEIAMNNFRQGTMSVTDMNTAQSERDQATEAFISALADYWKYYYSLRRKTLFDFVSGRDIGAEFDKMIQ